MPKTAAIASLTVCVQAISTEWSKNARGGAEAVQRNRVPEALKLPAFSFPASPISYVLHQARFTAQDNFPKPLQENIKMVAYEPVELKGVSLALSEESLIVFYQWTPSQGAPPRPTNKKEALALAIGDWGRVCYNGRHVDWDNGTWWYEKWVYNVGSFYSPTRSVFLTSQPAKISLHMAHLW